jgi:hypothetical protein
MSEESSLDRKEPKNFIWFTHFRKKASDLGVLPLRVSLLLVVSLLGAGSSWGQEASLRGLVTTSETGTALPQANVRLSTVSGERIGATATDASGFYQLQNLEPGPYLIEVTYVGYRTYEDTLALESGSNQYNVSLTRSDQELQEVQVEAERGATERQAGLQTITEADIERIPTPGPGGDLAAYVQTLPGVVSVGDRGGELYIRGGTPSQNLILVDGLRVIKPFHISNLYSAFSEDLVKSADVHAGGFNSEYMGAVSSVIDVSLRQGNLKSYQGGISVSPFIVSGRVEGPIRDGKDSFLAMARRSVVERTSSALFGRDVPLRFYDITTRYSLQLKSTSCNVTGLRTYDEGRINPNRELYLSWSNTVFGGRCLFFGEGLDRAIDLRAGYTHFRNEAGTLNSPQRSATVRKTYFSARSEGDFLGETLSYGGRWIVDSYSYDLDERFTTLQQNNQTVGAVQLHASLDWEVGDWLTLAPSFGTQLTIRRLSSPTYEPRLRASIRPAGTERHEISLALGKYNQFAEGLTDERDAGTNFTVWRPSEQGDPLLQALHGILGYRQKIGSSLTVNAEGYAKDLSNIPVPKWAAEARFDTETALADGVVYGVDLRTTFESRSLYAFVGYGWSKVRYTASRDNLGAWTRGEVIEYSPPHDRRHQVNAVVSYDIGPFTANANWKFASGRPYTRIAGFDMALDLRNQSAGPSTYPTSNPGTAQLFYDRPYNARLPTYHRLDISVERSFTLSSRLVLDAEVGAINGYNRRNVFYYDITTLERVDQTPVLPYAAFSLDIE